MNTTVCLNPELTNLAKELGLNISKTCENALKLAISRLQGLNPETTDVSPQFGANFGVVDRAGFEPSPKWRCHPQPILFFYNSHFRH
jgi:hypothetical protein